MTTTQKYYVPTARKSSAEETMDYLLWLARKNDREAKKKRR